MQQQQSQTIGSKELTSFLFPLRPEGMLQWLLLGFSYYNRNNSLSQGAVPWQSGHLLHLHNQKLGK